MNSLLFLWRQATPSNSPAPTATKRGREHIMFEWHPLLLVVSPLIWILDLPEIVSDALGGLMLPRSWIR